jgi:hypothetical protein
MEFNISGWNAPRRPGPGGQLNVVLNGNGTGCPGRFQIRRVQLLFVVDTEILRFPLAVA